MLRRTTQQKNFKKKRKWEENYDVQMVIDMKVLLDDVIEKMFEQIKENEGEEVKKYVIVDHFGKVSNAGVIIDTDRRFVTDFYKKLNKGFIVSPQTNNFSQVRVHQQFVWNFCGYHMLYNAYQLVKFYRTGKSIYLKQMLTNPNQSNANFWKFKHDMTNVLKRWAKKHKKTKDQLWNEKWRLNGDLERNHLVVLLTQSNLIRTAFMTNPAMFSRVVRLAKQKEYQNMFGIYSELIRLMYNTDYNILQQKMKFRKELYRPISDFSEDNLSVYLVEFQYNRFVTRLQTLANLQTNINKFRRKFAEILLNNKLDEADLVIESNQSIQQAGTAEEMGKAMKKYGMANFMKKKFSKGMVDNLVENAKEPWAIKKDLRRGKQASQIIVMFLGVCIHWVGLICHRFGKKIEFLLFDSKNNNYLFLNDKQIKRLIEQKTIENNWNEWKIKINTQCVYDYQTLMNLIMDSFNGEVNLMDHMFYQDIFKLLPLFKNHPLTRQYKKLMLKLQKKNPFVFETDKIPKLKTFTESEKSEGSGRFLHSEFNMKNKRHVLQFHIKEHEKFEGFARNKNPAEHSFEEGKTFDLEKEVYANLRTINKNISRYREYIEYLSIKAQTDFYRAERDVAVFNKIFKYDGSRRNRRKK